MGRRLPGGLQPGRPGERQRFPCQREGRGGLEVGRLRGRRSCQVQMSSWSQGAAREVWAGVRCHLPIGSSPRDMERRLWGSLPALECSAFGGWMKGRHPSDSNFGEKSRDLCC